MVVDRSLDTRRAQGEPKDVIDDDDPGECAEPRSSDAEEGEQSSIKAEITPTSSVLSSPVADARLNKDQPMHGMDDQDRLTYDMTPPARLIMKSSYHGPVPLAQDDTVSHHLNQHGIPQYEPSSVYSHGQPLEHQLYQRTDGTVPELQRRDDFSSHTLRHPPTSTMGHWLPTGPPDFCFPTQYQGMPSHVPTMQSTAGEQSVHDDDTYQVHQQESNQAINYTISPIFDQTTHPGFTEARDMNTPRWNQLAYRPASSSQVPISHVNDISLHSGSEQLYQARLCGLSDF